MKLPARIVPAMRWLLSSAALLAFVACGGVAVAQTTAGLDYQQWQTFQTRVDRVLSSGGASRDALKTLRSQVEEWEALARSYQEPLEEEILRLNQRLDAFASSEEAIGARSDIMDALRENLLERLVNASDQFFIAEEVSQAASAYLTEINAAISQRAGESLRARVASPLLSGEWLAAVQFAYTYVVSSVAEISQGLGIAAQRRAAWQELPEAVAWALLGLLLLFPGRRWIGSLTIRLEPKATAVARFSVQQLSALVANVVFPVGAAYALVWAFDATGLLFVNSQTLLASVPPAILAFCSTCWLTRLSGSDSGRDLFRVEVAPGQMLALQSYGISLACVLALWQLLQAIGQTATDEITGVLQFPLMLIAGFCVYRIGWHLVDIAQPADDQEEDAGLRGRLLVILARTSLVVALASVTFAVHGYAAGSAYLLLSFINTLISIGMAFAVFKISMEMYVLASRRVHRRFFRSAQGPVTLAVGFVLLVATFVALAYSWGLSTSDVLRILERGQQGIVIGGTAITVGAVAALIVVLIVGVSLTRLFQTLLQHSVLPNTNLERGAQRALVTASGYVGIGLSIVVAIIVAGLDLSNLAIVAGALSIGIGFGLQNIVSNFVSGIILLSERPINEGDWIECGNVVGTVRKVSVRSTHIETFDRATVVVPNSDLLSSQLQNWTLGNTQGRVIIPVGVAYGTNPKLIERVLLELAEEDEEIIDDPAPAVLFMGFGADSLDFQLRVFLDDISNILDVKSKMNFKISERFAREKIEIPFAQRDVWIRNPERSEDQ
ncbi:MAG: mechanosensitive ion channel [Rhodobacteraceae bacterium]|nr:mechanosensitive ion channel [Paracoccaceae bacterium]